MTSQISLFWRAFILLIFGPKVQAEVTFLQALKIAKVNEKIMTFLKLIGPCKKQKYFFYRNIYLFKLSNLRIKTNISQ